MEIANYGDLGYLKLKDIKIGYGGSLEIINRNFVKSYAASGGAALSDDTSRIHKLSVNAAQTQYKMINSVSSLDTSTVWSETQAVHIAATVISATNDIRLTNSINSVYQPFTSGQFSFICCYKWISLSHS